MAVKVYEDVDARGLQLGLDGEAERIFGFDSSDGLVNLLLSFTVMMIFPFFFTSLAYNIEHERRVLNIVLRSTGRKPELTLHKGKKYHLFNSHIWSTGQDVAATIKRQLQRIFPLVKVFLDGLPPCDAIEPQTVACRCYSGSTLCSRQWMTWTTSRSLSSS